MRNKENNPNEDLATQSEKIKSGKIEIPSHFKGKSGNRIPKY